MYSINRLWFILLGMEGCFVKAENSSHKGDNIADEKIIF